MSKIEKEKRKNEYNIQSINKHLVNILEENYYIELGNVGIKVLFRKYNPFIYKVFFRLPSLVLAISLLPSLLIDHFLNIFIYSILSSSKSTYRIPL